MLISVKVKPGAKVGPKLEKIGESEYVAYIRERAHDGEANVGLIKLLADEFKVPKTMITIKSGHTGRKKIVEI